MTVPVEGLRFATGREAMAKRMLEPSRPGRDPEKLWILQAGPYYDHLDFYLPPEDEPEEMVQVISSQLAGCQLQL